MMVVLQIYVLTTLLVSVVRCAPPRNGGLARGKNGGWEENAEDDGGWRDEDPWQQQEEAPKQQKGHSTPWVGISDIPWNVRVANAQQQQPDAWKQDQAWPPYAKKNGNGDSDGANGPWATKGFGGGWDQGAGANGGGPWQKQNGNDGAAKGWWDNTQGGGAAAWPANGGSNGFKSKKNGGGGAWPSGFGGQPWKTKNGNGNGQKPWASGGASAWDAVKKTEFDAGWQLESPPPQTVYQHQKKPHDHTIKFKDSKFSQADYTAPEEDDKEAADPWAQDAGGVGGGPGPWDQQEQNGGAKAWDNGEGIKSWDTGNGKLFQGQQWSAGPGGNGFSRSKGWDSSAPAPWPRGPVRKNKSWPSNGDGKSGPPPPPDAAEGAGVNGWLDLQKELYLLKNKVRVSGNGGWPAGGPGANGGGPASWKTNGGVAANGNGGPAPWAAKGNGNGAGPWVADGGDAVPNGGGNGGWQLKNGRGADQGWASSPEPVASASSGLTHMIFGGPPETASAWMMIRQSSTDSPVIIQTS